MHSLNRCEFGRIYIFVYCKWLLIHITMLFQQYKYIACRQEYVSAYYKVIVLEPLF